MKRLAFVGAALMMFSLTSCKKDRTCKCDGYKLTINASKSKAKAICEGKGVTVKNEAGDDVTNKCTLE